MGRRSGGTVVSLRGRPPAHRENRLAPDARTVQAFGACIGAKDIGTARMEIITGCQRRRSWNKEQKRAIVETRLREARSSPMLPGVPPVCAGQIRSLPHPNGFPSRHPSDRPRRQSLRRAGPGPAIEVEFAGAARVRLWHRQQVRLMRWKRSGRT